MCYEQIVGGEEMGDGAEGCSGRVDVLTVRLTFLLFLAGETLPRCRLLCLRRPILVGFIQGGEGGIV